MSQTLSVCRPVGSQRKTLFIFGGREEGTAVCHSIWVHPGLSVGCRRPSFMGHRRVLLTDGAILGLSRELCRCEL
jgi:hypothetical protein